MTNEIYVRSPVRVDLSGGTIDCWPLNILTPGSVTLNLGVSVFTDVRLTPRTDKRVLLKVRDLNFEMEFKDLDECLQSDHAELTLLKPHLKFWQPKEGFSLETSSQSPVGAGLGGSSSLCVSLIKAFSRWLNRRLEALEIVTLACNLETEILQKPAGTQDYFPALRGGLNLIEYRMDGPKWSLLDLPLHPLETRLMVVYTGRAHHSGLNNWDVIQRAVENDQKVRGALNQIAEISRQSVTAVRAQDWDQFPELFRREYQARIQLTEKFSSPEIEKIFSIVNEVPQAAVKICGAGGGGCVLVWCPPSVRPLIQQNIEKQGFQVLNARPWKENE